MSKHKSLSPAMTQQRQLQLPLAAALLSALSGSLWAESAAYQELDPVVVTATRTAQPAFTGGLIHFGRQGQGH